jgi:hypothetical protein
MSTLLNECVFVCLLKAILNWAFSLIRHLSLHAQLSNILIMCAFFWKHERLATCIWTQYTQSIVVGRYINISNPLLGSYNTDTSRLNFKFFRLTQLEKKTKKKFKHLKRAKFLIAGMKAQWDKGGRRVLLGDDTGGGQVMLWPIRFQCVWVWISTGLFCIYVFSWPCVWLIPICTKFALWRSFRNVAVA